MLFLIFKFCLCLNYQSAREGIINAFGARFDYDVVSFVGSHGTSIWSLSQNQVIHNITKVFQDQVTILQKTNSIDVLCDQISNICLDLKSCINKGTFVSCVAENEYINLSFLSAWFSATLQQNSGTKFSTHEFDFDFKGTSLLVLKKKSQQSIKIDENTATMLDLISTRDCLRIIDSLNKIGVPCSKASVSMGGFCKVKFDLQSHFYTVDLLSPERAVFDFYSTKFVSFEQTSKDLQQLIRTESNINVTSVDMLRVLQFKEQKAKLLVRDDYTELLFDSYSILISQKKFTLTKKEKHHQVKIIITQDEIETLIKSC